MRRAPSSMRGTVVKFCQLCSGKFCIMSCVFCHTISQRLNHSNRDYPCLTQDLNRSLYILLYFFHCVVIQINTERAQSTFQGSGQTITTTMLTRFTRTARERMWIGGGGN